MENTKMVQRVGILNKIKEIILIISGFPIYEEVSSNIDRIPIYKDEVVNCEKCGCIIFKSIAIKGESEIREHNFIFYKEEYIYNPFYCRKCFNAEKIQNEKKSNE